MEGIYRRSLLRLAGLVICVIHHVRVDGSPLRPRDDLRRAFVSVALIALDNFAVFSLAGPETFPGVLP